MLKRVLARLRRYLVVGLIVVAPVGVTAWILSWLFRRLDSVLGQYLPAVGADPVPGLGLLILVVLLIFVGWTLQWALGRKLVSSWNTVLSRLPLTRSIYNAAAQIVQTLLNRQEKLFQSCVLIEYPMTGSYTLAFITSRAPEEFDEHLEKDGITVFLPTSPNPTSGYLLVLPSDRVTPLEMTVEEGIKMVISIGTVIPGREDRPLAGIDLERLTGGQMPRELRLGGRRRRADEGEGREDDAARVDLSEPTDRPEREGDKGEG